MANIKEENYNFWTKYPCGKDFSNKDEFTLDFFKEIEEERYKRQPFVFSFAQFTRFYGKKVLEVGVGMGIDFLQWVRTGAKAYGIDITEVSIQATEKLLEFHNLKAEELRVADVESLPYPDNFFDLVYSWGVIHHTNDVKKALSEIIRVTSAGGKIKIMVYNRFSLVAFYIWIRHALFKLMPWRSLSWCISNFLQNKGTKAFLPSEIKKILKKFPVSNIKIKTILTYADRLEKYHNKFLTFFINVLAYFLGGDRVGLYMLVEFEKKHNL